MALSKSTITGRVPLPSDENLQFAELTFALSGLDTEGASVLPGGVSTRIVLIDSDIPAGFELWQNTAGLHGTHYRVLARWTVKDRDGIRDQYADLGVIQVGASASYTLADLINSGVPQAVGTFWTVLSQAEYDAAIQAATDAQAWAESPTPPDPLDPTSKSSKTWAGEAAGYAALVDLGALDNAVVATAADVLSADAARVLAESARDAALLATGLFPTTAAGIGQGVSGTASLVGGSAGTDGTFALAFSGGTQVVAPRGRFVVAGGIVTQVIIDYPGYYSAGTPTISFAASSGLTGASVTAVMGPNTPVGGYFSVLAPATDETVIYRVDAGPVATEVERLLTSAFLAKFADMNGYLDPDNLFVWRDAASNIVGKVELNAEWDILLKSLKSSAVEIYDYQMIGGDTPFIVTDAVGKILYEAPPPGVDATAEVIAARGSAASLTARLNKYLSASGVTLDPSFNRATLRNAHYKLTKRKLGEAEQLNIGCIGDSYTQNASRWTKGAADILTATYGDGGGGWTGYGWFGAAGGPWVYPGTQPSGINGNARSTYGMAFSGAWTCAYNSADGPDLASVSSSSAGAYVRRTVPATPDHTALRVLFIGTADGVLRHRVDAGTWTTQNVQGTVGALQTFDIALTAGAHTVEIEVVSGTVTLCGDNALSDASGVRLHKLGGSGSNIGQWTARNETNQRVGWQALAVDTFVVLDGTNSQAAMTHTAWAAHMVTLIARLRAAAAVPDILIAMPPENMRVNTYPMPLFTTAGRDIAYTSNVAFVDMQPDFGIATADYAAASTRPLFNVDGIHPEPSTGGRVIVAVILNLIDL